MREVLPEDAISRQVCADRKLHSGLYWSCRERRRQPPARSLARLELSDRPEIGALTPIDHKKKKREGDKVFANGCNIVVRAVEGERPRRPRGVEGMRFGDDVRRILECCWKPIPGGRPKIRDVLECLETVSRSWTPLPPQMLAGTPTADLPGHSLDSNGEESTDRGEVSSSSQVSSSWPSREHLLTGESNENNT